MSDKFQKIYDQSIKNPKKFWQEASDDIFLFKKPTKILNKSNFICYLTPYLGLRKLKPGLYKLKSKN